METIIFVVLGISGFCAGAILGSGLLCLYMRGSFKEWWTRYECNCDSCGRKLTAREQIPIIGYLTARGNCRTCKAAIPPECLLSELIGGAWISVLTLTVYKMISASAGNGQEIAYAAVFAVFGIVILVNAIADLNSACISLINVILMWLLAFIMQVMNGNILLGLVSNAIIFGAYVFIYCYQRLCRSEKNPACKKDPWDLEVIGFGIGDVLLLCTILNIGGLMGVGACFIYAVVFMKIAEIIFFKTGHWMNKSKSFRLYPYCLAGMAVYFAFGLIGG